LLLFFVFIIMENEKRNEFKKFCLGEME